MRFLKTLFLIVGLSSVIACGSSGGGGGGNNVGAGNSTVSGTVLDTSGAPINNAEVTISSTPVTVTTDATGKFSAVVETGDHSIIVKVGASTIYNSTFTCNGDTCNLGNVAADFCDFTGWKKHLNNPVFSSSGSGGWDNPLRSGTVLKDEDEPLNKYKRWYVGGATAFDEGMSIGYATSSDGINWVPYSNNPVMTHGNTWDINGLSGIHVVKERSVYKLWYEGVDNSGVNRIGYATSPDGINWTPYQNNPIFSPGANGAWDDDDVGNPWVLKEGSTYKMWYWADNDLTDIDQIGLATSSDGINWQRSGSNPVLSPNPAISWENGEGIGAPKVIKSSSGYTMAYHGAAQLGGVRIGFATSSDGETWNKDSNNPILDIGTGNAWDSAGIGPDALIEDAISLKLWFLGADASEGIKVGMAVSCK